MSYLGYKTMCMCCGSIDALQHHEIQFYSLDLMRYRLHKFPAFYSVLGFLSVHKDALPSTSAAK